MYGFGKWWKWKISLMGFVYRVVWVLKKLYHRVMYVAPSSGHVSLNCNMHFKLWVFMRLWVFLAFVTFGFRSAEFKFNSHVHLGMILMLPSMGKFIIWFGHVLIFACDAREISRMETLCLCSLSSENPTVTVSTLGERRW